MMRERHNLVWLSPAGWQIALQQAAPECQDFIAQWRDADWPTIVRRADQDNADEISVGIAVSPHAADGRKQKIALQMPLACASRWSSPLEIAAVLDSAPPAWQPSLALLEQQAIWHELPLRVFGSLAMQALTRQAYLTPSSDIDLLLLPNSPDQLDQGMELFEYFARILPLDGEILFPTGQAVALKEWQATSGRHSRILVKTRNSVSLITRAALMATLQEKACKIC